MTLRSNERYLKRSEAYIKERSELLDRFIDHVKRNDLSSYELHHFFIEVKKSERTLSSLFKKLQERLLVLNDVLVSLHKFLLLEQKRLKELSGWLRRTVTSSTRDKSHEAEIKILETLVMLGKVPLDNRKVKWFESNEKKIRRLDHKDRTQKTVCAEIDLVCKNITIIFMLIRRYYEQILSDEESTEKILADIDKLTITVKAHKNSVHERHNRVHDNAQDCIMLLHKLKKNFRHIERSMKEEEHRASLNNVHKIYARVQADDQNIKRVA